MDNSVNAVIRCGSFNGFDYVYGFPEGTHFEDVIPEFPNQLKNGQRIIVFEDCEYGTVYIAPEIGRHDVPIEVLQHIHEECANSQYDWFQFENVRDFATFMTMSESDKNVQLYFDKAKRKYYARRDRRDVSSIVEFAKCVDAKTTLALEKNKTLTKVEYKEEEN